MIDAFINGLLLILQWKAFAYMLVGVTVGFWVGILPGIGGGTTLALMIPFVYKMSPTEAIPFLLGMHSVVGTTGDITSILFGIPGEVVSVALIQDGYPMSKKGEAGRALGAALMSSLVGAVIGAAALTLAIPMVRPLVLAFATPELFMVVIIGLTCISTLSGQGKRGLLLGLLAGGFGFLCSLVGQDQHSGVHRYTFGLLYFWNGLPLIPVLVGIYAIPEIIEIMVSNTAIAGEAPPGDLGKGVGEGIKDTFRHFWLTVRCSIVGALLGIFPGVGAGVGQWAAYAQAVNSAKTPEERAGFGKGDVRGVLGPGAANNSKEGGSLIPTIAFGIPGTPGMAILLGAFLLMGIVPGQDMLTKHLSLTFSMVWTIVLSNVIAVSVCLLFINRIARLTAVRATLVVPFLLFLCFLGAYCASNSAGDLIILLVFGVFGQFMMRFNWPRPPFALGFILGPLAEAYLYTSTHRYGAEWLFRPAVLLLLAIAVLVALYPYLKERALRKKAGIVRADRRAEEIAGPRVRWGGKAWMSLSILAVVLWMIVSALKWPFRSLLFPIVIGTPVFLMSAAELWFSVSDRETSTSTESLPPGKMFRAFIPIVSFLLLVLLIGFPLAVPLFVLSYLKFYGREKWGISLLLSCASWVFLYGLFVRVLHTPFEEGWVIELLSALL
jgi:putative tricarboxylic transport membrane protein